MSNFYQKLIQSTLIAGGGEEHVAAMLKLEGVF